MDSRQRRDLDNHITGHYGEDQFKGQEDESDELEDSVHSVPINAECMRCGQSKLCTRVIDIGWICLDCQKGEAHG